MSDLITASFGRAYDRAEFIADGVVHAVGVIGGLAGAALLLVLAAGLVGALEFTSVVIYAAGLVAMLGFSAAYNMTHHPRAKALLRRCDHSAIYVMIAGTYTPFLTQLKSALLATGMSAFIWAGALAGVTVKLIFPGRFDRLAIVAYLALGWSVVAVIEPLTHALPASAFIWLVAGGLLYTAGVIFHVWETLKFQNAIWHVFVLSAAACHYVAVLDCMVLSRA